MIVETCQRFTEGRESRRPAGEVIAPSAFDVAPVSAQLARAFVARHHYAKTSSPPAHPFGLYRHGDLVGVALFGPAPSMAAKAWLRRWRAALTRPMRHFGNYRYLWCLDRRRRREVLTREAQPYPKFDVGVIA